MNCGMTITLRALTLDECQQVREWRNAPDVLPMLRTGVKTEDEQATFFRDVVSNPASDHRYYAIEADGEFVGMGGLTYLSRVPGEAEISLILGPAARGRGIGNEAVLALVIEARRIGLTRIVGECYRRSPALGFWKKFITLIASDYQWDGNSLKFSWKIA